MGNQRIEKTLHLFLKHFILFISAFCCAGVVIVLVFDSVVMPFYQRPKSQIVTPDFRGMSLEEAKKVSAKMKLSLLEEQREYHPTYPVNTLSFQIPAPGTIVKPGRRIRVTISLGPQPLTVPVVVGKTPREAKEIIREAGLSIEEGGWKPSNEYSYGIVADQVPRGGLEVTRNTVVIIYISNGKRVTNVIMPNLINLSVEAARDTLRAYNFSLFRLKIQKEEQPDLLPGTVIEQYPDPGVPAMTSGEVNLVVSTTP